MEKKISLVLEGGGMRGAYTAGCLSWLLDNNIEFNCGYGISTGAVYLTAFIKKDKEFLKKTSTDIICDKTVLGLSPCLREGRLVGYDYLFKHHLKETCNFDIGDIKKETDAKAKYGVYSLNAGKTEYIELKDMNMDLLKAACTLPIIGKRVKVDGKVYLDGGITKMIPIEEAIDDGCDKHLIITTKPLHYVRKPAKGIVVWLMKKFYPECQNISKDYKVRHLNYQKQIDIINQLKDEGKAIYRYPSKEIPVSRLRGNKKDLTELFELGRSDMEAIKEDIFNLVK
ncbi:MAG: patatin family protein [Erysipelotrichaceae bacterium]|nr:patatin family protein [Erysipelotrichaceae bacterium]